MQNLLPIRLCTILDKLKSGVSFQLKIAESNRLVYGEFYESVVMKEGKTFIAVTEDGRSSPSSCQIACIKVSYYSNSNTVNQPEVGTLYRPIEKNKCG